MVFLCLTLPPSLVPRGVYEGLFPHGKGLSLHPSEGHLGGCSVCAIRSSAALIIPVCRVLGAHTCVGARGTAGFSFIDTASSF